MDRSCQFCYVPINSGLMFWNWVGWNRNPPKTLRTKFLSVPGRRKEYLSLDHCNELVVFVLLLFFFFLFSSFDQIPVSSYKALSSFLSPPLSAKGLKALLKVSSRSLSHISTLAVIFSSFYMLLIFIWFNFIIVSSSGAHL